MAKTLKSLLKEFDISAVHDVAHHIINHGPTIAAVAGTVLAHRSIEAVGEKAAEKAHHHIKKFMGHFSKKGQAKEKESVIAHASGRAKPPHEGIHKPVKVRSNDEEVKFPSLDGYKKMFGKKK